MKMTFEEYMRRVNAMIEIWTGQTSDDIDDYDYRSAYEDEVRPGTCASQALHAAGL